MPSEARAAWTARSITRDGADSCIEAWIDRAEAALILYRRSVSYNDLVEEYTTHGDGRERKEGPANEVGNWKLQRTLIVADPQVIHKL